MLKHKRFIKIVSALLAVAFVFSTLTINANATQQHGTGNVATGTGNVGN